MVPLSDTAGECWLAAHDGRPITPRLAALRMHASDAGLHRVRRDGLAIWSRALPLGAYDAPERPPVEPIDPELVRSVRDAADAELDGLSAGLEAGLDHRTIARVLGCSTRTIRRAIARVRERFLAALSRGAP